MKRWQYMTTFSLIVALTGLSPVMAADGGGTSDGGRTQPDQRQFGSRTRYKLSPEQMDKVSAGHLGSVKYEDIKISSGTGVSRSPSVMMLLIQPKELFDLDLPTGGEIGVTL